CSPVTLFSSSSRRRHTRSKRDWSSDVCSSDLTAAAEYATPNLVDVLTQIVQLRARLYAAVQANIHTKRQILDRLKNAPVLQEPRSEERRVGKECRSRRWAET